MDDRAIGLELERDLLRAAATGKILYLEGTTDVTMLLGLLGREPPAVIPEEGLPIDGVWVRGLSGSTGAGSKAVEQRIRVAASRPELRGIHGVIDGDGRDYTSLAATFDPPHSGPLHTWKAYCLENLLAQCGWPRDWGPTPDWRVVLEAYIPYAALNRVVVAARHRWLSLGVARFGKPVLRQQRQTAPEIRARLREDEATIRQLAELVVVFDEAVNRCETAVATSLAHAHALINGKWLVEVHAAEASHLSPEICRREWSRHIGSVGGHPEVLDWWRHLLAS